MKPFLTIIESPFAPRIDKLHIRVDKCPETNLPMLYCYTRKGVQFFAAPPTHFYSKTRPIPLAEFRKARKKAVRHILAAIERANLNYLHEALRHSTALGEVPFASHMFFTQFLDDTDPTERAIGMNLGFAFFAAAAQVAVYTDLGISAGMKQGIANARNNNIPVTYRTIGDRIKKAAPDE